MKTRKKTTKKRKASPAQVAARKKFVAAVKTGKFRKSAKKKAVKRPARKAAKKRNGRTVIKAKRVVVIQKNAKRIPRKPNITSAQDLHLAGSATPASQGGMQGWKLTSKGKFYPGSATPKTVALNKSKTAFLDLKYGDVWKRKAKGNPKRRKNIQMMAGGGTYPVRASWDYDPVRAGETRQSRADYFSRPHVIGGKKVSGAKLKKMVEQKQHKAVLAAQERLDKARASKDAERIEKAKLHLSDTREKVKAAKVTGGARKTDKQTAARRVGRQQVKAETKARKATTTRLASRLLDRSGPKATRNPGVAEKLQEWRGYPKDRDDKLRFPDGTPSGLYKLGALKKIVTTHNTINFASNQAWLCADTKGKLYVGGIAKSAAKGRMTNVPAGSLGKVTRVEYLEKKPHLKDYDKTLYFHKMGEEDGNKPTLYSDGDGNLLFRGGNYQVTYRGIVN